MIEIPNETKKELMSEIDMAFRMISSIPVSGDAVDAMSAARSKLRNVYSKLEKLEEKTEEIEE